MKYNQSISHTQLQRFSQRGKNDNTITVGDVLATYQVYQAFALYHGLSLQAETYQVPVTNQNSMICEK